MTHIRGLGYLKVQTRHIDRWREFALDGLGFAEGSGSNPDGLYLRMDERRSRLQLLPGDTDKVLAVGWEVRDQYALTAVREAVEKAGTAVAVLTAKEAEERDAEEVIAFTDPGGTPVEVFHGAVLDHGPVRTGFAQSFVTGAMGMGHVVLPTPNFAETATFYNEVLGFLPRGAMKVAPGVRIRFMGVNQRHHGIALDTVKKKGFSISSTLGRHTNDKMVSFYVRAPGGWDIEYGCEGTLVDETHYTAEEITADSYWGHDWSGSEPLAAFAPPGK
jgi:2,3-dihydroxybiphenyl 1,2-dioxygenase